MMNGGCGSSATGFAAWRHGLERYVIEQGAGDPAVLRNLPRLRSPNAPRPSRVVFGVLDVPERPGLFAGRCDIQGVLLGIPEVDAQYWHCFLVGQLRCGPWSPTEVRDLRLIAFARQGDQWIWRTSKEEPDAFNQYATARRIGTADAFATFPAPHDVLELKATPRAITARDVQSGATWHLTIPKPASTSMQQQSEPRAQARPCYIGPRFDICGFPNSRAFVVRPHSGQVPLTLPVRLYPQLTQ
jgi:hypothetical protein